MKVSLQQQACRATTGTQDWTDGVFASDMKGAMFFGSLPTTNDTAFANIRLMMGGSDLTNNTSHIVCAATDAVDPNVTAISQRYTGTDCVTYGKSAAETTATVSATLATGLTLNYSVVNGTQSLFNGVLVGGSDVAVGVSKTSKPASTSPVTVTHNCGGTPDIIILQSAVGISSDPQSAQPITIITFWERYGSTTSTVSWSNPNLSVNTDVGAYITTTNNGRWVTVPAPTLNTIVTIQNVGATTFELAYASGNPSNLWQHNAYCIRGVSAQMYAKCGVFTTPTSTGNNAPITGMVRPPVWLITIPTRMTAETTLTTDDSAGGYGVGMAVNNGGSTQQAASSFAFQDNVASTVAKCRTSNAQALMVLDNTGAAQTAATVNSWDSAGVTLNYSVASATAYKVAYIAISAPAASTSGGAGIMMMGCG